MKKFKPNQLALLISLAFSPVIVLAQATTDVGKINVEGLPGGTDTGLINQEESPKARLVGVSRTDRLQHGLVAELEEMRRLGECVGVGAAHEAVSHHADVESFLCHGLSPPSHARRGP